MSVNLPQWSISEQVKLGAIPPFVYAYPPRSSYRALPAAASIDDIWSQDIVNSGTKDLNVYIHVPFCRYKCGFCNLYTITSRRGDVYSEYVNAVCRELKNAANILQGRNIRTLYIGGGTPSLLHVSDFELIFEQLDLIVPHWRHTVEEVCTEASPDSLAGADGRSKIRLLGELGVNRVNLGIESLDETELRDAGRSLAGIKEVYEAVGAVKDASIPNLSTDLIIGFKGQTDRSWHSSISKLIELSPQTISTYYLTIRPDAWFGARGIYQYDRSAALYHRYDAARELLAGAGYQQETNVRWVRRGTGGYLQKTLQFRGVPVLGIGLGARTYTNTIDYMRWLPLVPSAIALRKYLERRDFRDPVQYGFRYSNEERIRKRLALDLFDLNIDVVMKNAHPSLRRDIRQVLAESATLGLIESSEQSRYVLTPRGFKYRDIMSWAFFSGYVRKLDREFYQELGEKVDESSRSTATQLTNSPSTILLSPKLK